MDQSNLPPAAKLAALIEAGRAANPDLKQGRGLLLRDDAACGIGFAALAIGMPRDYLRAVPPHESAPYTGVARAVGVEPTPHGSELTAQVARMNDCGASLDEICASLREGELAKVSA